MKICVVLTLFVFASAQSRTCPAVYFNGLYFDMETLKDGVNRIHDMTYNANENILYFIFEQIAQIPMQGLGFLNLGTKQTGIIEGVRNATCLTIDNIYNIVYVGGADGIYKLNGNSVPEMLPIRDSIQHVFFKDILYYTNMRNEAFIYHNGYIDRLWELQGVKANRLVLDDDQNLFFTRGKSLYRLKLGSRAVNTHEGYKVDTIAVNNYYKPFVATSTGIYVYNKYKYVLDKVSDMRGLRALTFTKNNEPIFCVLDAIYKLMYNAEKCYDTNVIS